MDKGCSSGSRFPAWMALLLAVCVLGAARQTDNAPRRIEISAKRFAFTPNEITLKVGEPVVLVLHSQDVTHGMFIPDLGVKTDIPAGKSIEVPLTADKTGDFGGMCGHFCGIDHASMTFKVHVTE
jgi:cytochrome c oxidase subunit II